MSDGPPIEIAPTVNPEKSAVPPIIGQITTARKAYGEYRDIENKRKGRIRDLAATGETVSPELKLKTQPTPEAALGEKINTAEIEVSQTCDSYWQNTNARNANARKTRFDDLKSKIITRLSEKKGDPETVASAIAFVRENIGGRRSWQNAQEMLSAAPEVLYDTATAIYDSLYYEVRNQGPLELRGAAENIVRRMANADNLPLDAQRREELQYWRNQLDGAEVYDRSDASSSSASLSETERFNNMLPQDIKSTLTAADITEVQITRKIGTLNRDNIGLLLAYLSRSEKIVADPQLRKRFEGMTLGYVESYLLGRPSDTAHGSSGEQEWVDMTGKAANMLQSLIGDDVSVFEAIAREDHVGSESSRLVKLGRDLMEDRLRGLHTEIVLKRKKGEAEAITAAQATLAKAAEKKAV